MSEAGVSPVELCENETYQLAGTAENYASVQWSSSGTAGTLMGIEKSIQIVVSNCKIVALEPASSPIISKGIKGAHNVEGVGLGFIPALYNPEYVHNAIAIEESTARKTCRDLAIREGIFCGTSSGMNVAGALKLSAKLNNFSQSDL